MTDKNKKDRTDPVDPADPAGLGDDVVVETLSAEDDVLVGADVPYELREDRPDPSGEPKTGLVSDFRDLTGRQAAWLVSNRETVAVSRSPLFYVTSLILGLAVIAAIIIGVQAASKDPSGSTLATVGLGPQAKAAEQQFGFTIKDTKSVEEAQKLVRDGEADAALIVDPSGMGQQQIIALNSEPTAILDKLQKPVPVTYLEQPPVESKPASVFMWGMAILLLASVLTLGAALYANARVEKRNRLAEVIAATIPARAAAWGRVYGLTVLSLVYLVITVGVLMLGLSIASFSTLALSALPGIGWFAALFVVVNLMYLSLFLWAATPAGRRVRQVGFGVIIALVAAGVFVPTFFVLKTDILRILSYIPFTAPVAMPMRYFAGQAEWWEGLLAVGIALVLALVFFGIASSAYERNLLRGAGHGGRTVKPRKKGAAGKSAAGKAEVKAGKAGADEAKAGKPAGTAAKAEADAAGTATDTAAEAEETGEVAEAEETAAQAKPGATAAGKKPGTAQKSGSAKKP